MMIQSCAHTGIEAWNCLYGMTRNVIVVQLSGQVGVLDILHERHPEMKALARSTVWWPNIDEELQLKVKEC